MMPPSSSSPSAAAAAGQASSLEEHGYRALQGDEVDGALAEFLNQPRNRLRRVLFSRVGAGTYLYGTCRVLVRRDPASGRLEGVEEDALSGSEAPWASIEELSRRVERYESSRLGRARQR